MKSVIKTAFGQKHQAVLHAALKIFSMLTAPAKHPSATRKSLRHAGRPRAKNRWIQIAALCFFMVLLLWPHTPSQPPIAAGWSDNLLGSMWLRNAFAGIAVFTLTWMGLQQPAARRRAVYWILTLSLSGLSLGLSYQGHWLSPWTIWISAANAYLLWHYRTIKRSLQKFECMLGLPPFEPTTGVFATEARLARLRLALQNQIGARKQLQTQLQTERQQANAFDETLRFLSHDLRAPHASMLALITLQHKVESALPPSEFLDRAAQYARRATVLADGFIQLRRADCRAYDLQPVHLNEALQEAQDEVWAVAHAKQTIMHSVEGPPSCVILADRSILVRALTNLLLNAVQHNPPRTAVHSRVYAEGRFGWCEIKSENAQTGYSPQDATWKNTAAQPSTAHKFQRLGLGLVFVHTVIERHSGQMTIHNASGCSPCIRVGLPLVDPNTRF